MTLRNFTHDLKLQQAFRAFARIDHWNAPHAVTLTMKQGMSNLSDHGLSHVSLSSDRASQNFSHFSNLLNRHVYGKAHERFGSKVRIIPLLEGDMNKRLHYHCMIDCPRTDSLALYPATIDLIWRKTFWGHREIDIQPNADKGWINYISKFRDKISFEESIDWLNYHNPD